MNAKMRAVWAAAYADALWKDPRDIVAVLRLEGPQTPYTIAAEWADHAVRTLAHTMQGRELLEDETDNPVDGDVEAALAEAITEYLERYEESQDYSRTALVKSLRHVVEKRIGRPLRSSK